MQQAAIVKVVDYALENPAKAAQWGAEFAGGIIQGFKNLFQGAKRIQDRHRSLQLTFVNATSKEVTIKENYFASGTWYNSFPATIPAKAAVVGGVANCQGGILTGVSGGLGLHIQGTNINLALGFTNPQLGSYKNYAALRHQSQNNGTYGHSESWDNYPKSSKLGGYTLQVQQVKSQVAQMGVLWTLSQKE